MVISARIKQRIQGAGLARKFAMHKLGTFPDNVPGCDEGARSRTTGQGQNPNQILSSIVYFKNEKQPH